MKDATAGPGPHPQAFAGQTLPQAASESPRSLQNLVVLGATGTIGRNTLDVARRHKDKLVRRIAAPALESWSC